MSMARTKRSFEERYRLFRIWTASVQIVPQNPRATLTGSERHQKFERGKYITIGTCETDHARISTICFNTLEVSELSMERSCIKNSGKVFDEWLSCAKGGPRSTPLRAGVAVAVIHDKYFGALLSYWLVLLMAFMKTQLLYQIQSIAWEIALKHELHEPVSAVFRLQVGGLPTGPAADNRNAKTANINLTDDEEGDFEFIAAG